jgi:amidase
MFASVRGELLGTDRHRIAPEIVWNLEKGMGLSADEILRAERTRAAIFRSVAAFFERFDLLACPVVAVPPFPVERRFPTEIGGEALTTYIDWMFLTFVLTLAGCPAISVPCGLTRDGLPVGLQLMGAPRAEHAVLAAAALLEAETGLARQVPRDPG